MKGGLGRIRDLGEARIILSKKKEKKRITLKSKKKEP